MTGVFALDADREAAADQLMRGVDETAGVRGEAGTEGAADPA